MAQAGRPRRDRHGDEHGVGAALWVAAAAQPAVTRAMPGDGFAVVRPLQNVVDNQTQSWRLGATLFVAFGGLALCRLCDIRSSAA